MNYSGVTLPLFSKGLILSKRGPVVIDWTNAARGNPLVDVAATWVLLASANVPGGRLDAAMAKVGRRILVRAFLGHFSKTELSSVLRGVVEWKSQDAHMSSAELERMRSLL